MTRHPVTVHQGAYVHTVPWTPQFEAVLRRHLPLLADGQPITPDLALADHGLTSLAVVSFLLELEDEFAVSIPDELLTSANFANPTTVWSVLQHVRGSRSAAVPTNGASDAR